MSSAGRYGWVGRGLFSALAGVLVCVVVAAPVFAFASRRTQIITVPVNGPVTFGSSTATCPAGQNVLFGGFENAAVGMRRTAGNRWTVYAFNYGIPYPGSSSPISLSSYVYCGSGPMPSKATSTVELHSRPGGTAGSATARCPAGTVVVAGGFATTPHSVVIVTGLERVASDLWRVSASLIGSSHSALTSIAYCGPGPAPKLVAQTIKAGGLTRAVRADCPAGRRLVLGGAIVTGVGDTFLQTLRVPAKTKNSWAVTGYGGEGRLHSGTLTSLAYCR
jgi:hypothetical protein